MSCKNVLERLLHSGTIADVLQRGPESKPAIAELQTILHEMGFDHELKWSQTGADGIYGDALALTISTFCRRNGINLTPDRVTSVTARWLIARYDILDELQDIEALLNANTVAEQIQKGSKDKQSIAAAQTLLHELGYEQELQWQKYHNDGDYGSSTAAAMKSFAVDEKISCDGESLSAELARKMLQSLGVHFGDDWTVNPKSAGMPATANGASDGQAVLATFSGSNFQGKKLVCDVEFIPALERINQYAKENEVKIHVTSSYRKDANVKGAIVTPAKRSNHMAGHAIDMNIAFKGGFANSAYLKDEAGWSSSVRGFITAIRKDDELRWGGDFRKKDVVHIDDALNIRDRDLWDQRYKALQTASLS